MIGLGLPRGFLVTLKNFVRAPVTVQYPDRHVGLFGAAKEAARRELRADVALFEKKKKKRKGLTEIIQVV